MENSENFQGGKLHELPIQKISNISNSEIPKNSEKFQLGKFDKFAILKIPKFFNLANSKNFQHGEEF